MNEAAPKLPRVLWVVAGLGLVGFAIYGLRAVLSPIFFAFMIAYLLDPLVDRFEKRVPRAVGIVLVLGIALAAMTLFFVLLLPSVVHEVLEFGNQLPDKLTGLKATVEPWLREYGIELPHDFEELRAMVQHYVSPEGKGAHPEASQELATRAGGVLATLWQWVLGGTATLMSVVGSLVVVPVLAFYLLHDFDRITTGIRDLVPHRYRPFVVDVAKEIDQVLGQFIRGQLLVMLTLAVLYSIAFSIARIPLAIPIGIIAGMLSFIPYVGGASALILGLSMCALGFESWWQVGGVLIGYAVIQALEGLVITPRIVGDKVGLSAVWVLVALMIGGELFGFLGVLLAVPAAAVAKIFVLRAVAHYRKSAIFNEGKPAETHSALVGFLEEEGLPDDAGLAAAKLEAHEEWPTDADPADSVDEADASEPTDFDEDEAPEEAVAEPPPEEPAPDPEANRARPPEEEE
ncbi:MAG: AI-2E family transporter [Sandaracinaceae bacterium]|nr:AI-2E family transporter [Sandaracinaceae bacterium]